MGDVFKQESCFCWWLLVSPEGLVRSWPAALTPAANQPYTCSRYLYKTEEETHSQHFYYHVSCDVIAVQQLRPSISSSFSSSSFSYSSRPSCHGRVQPHCLRLSKIVLVYYKLCLLKTNYVEISSYIYDSMSLNLPNQFVTTVN